MSASERGPQRPPAEGAVDGKPDPVEVSFSEALAELEQILGRIEHDDVDLDRLASELGRAAELLEVCRRKIRKAELEVSHIVEKIGGEGPR